MQTKKLLLLTVITFTSLQAYTQQFSGTITNTNTEALENARVILQYPDLNPQNDTVYSDASGYYMIGETVGIEDISLNSDESISYTYKGNKLSVNISSEHNITTGKLYGIDGRQIAEFLLHKTESNIYTGQISLNKLHNQLVIFTDAYHACKILLINNNSNTMTPSHRITYNKNTKDANYHLIIETDDLYQPIDSVLENINPSQSYSYDFECEPWPEYFADLTVTITGYENILLQGASVDLNGDNLSLTELTDANGQAFFTDINVGNNPDNLLLAGEIDISLDAGNINWYDNMPQDLQTVTEGTYEFNYNLQATINDYIKNLQSNVEGSGDPVAINWTLQNNNGSEIYATGNTDATGNGQINYQYRYPGEMSNLELIAQASGFENDTTHNITILPGNITTTNISMTQIPAEAYFWRVGQDELGQLGTTFDIVVMNTEYNYNDTLFNVDNNIAWRDTVPVNQNGTTTYTVKYIPHTLEGKIPLYPTTINFDLTNGETSQGYDLIHALEQETKFVVHSRDFDNNGNHINTRFQLYDSVGSLVYEEDAPSGTITTPYVDLPFTGTVKLTPLNGSVVDDTKYGVEFEVSKTNIQTDFNKTDTVAGYVMSISQQDPYTGEWHATTKTMYGEIDDDNINASLAMFGVENVYFPYGKHQDYESFKQHLHTILGYNVNENEVTSSGDVGSIDDYNPYTNNYQNELVWTITFGNNSTNPNPITPIIFGKNNITSRGTNGYDLEAPDGWAGSVREYMRRLGSGTVYSVNSVMNPSLPSGYSQNLSVEDRVYFSDFPKWQETKLYENLNERNQATWDDLFVPVKIRQAQFPGNR